MTVTVLPVSDGRGCELIRALFREYQQFLNVDLCFQQFEQELAELPGAYAAPRGMLAVAVEAGGAEALYDPDRVIGCVGVRPGPLPHVAELKRLYVKPSAQGRGAGKALLLAALGHAREAGYAEVWLDSLRRLDKAAALYQAHGFETIAPYNRTPMEDVYFMGKRL